MVLFGLWFSFQLSFSARFLRALGMLKGAATRGALNAQDSTLLRAEVLRGTLLMKGPHEQFE